MSDPTAPVTRDPTALREAAQALVIFAGRFSAGDSDVQREDLQVAIDDLRAALAAPPAAPSEDAAAAHRVALEAIESSWQDSGYAASPRLSRAAHAAASAVLSRCVLCGSLRHSSYEHPRAAPPAAPSEDAAWLEWATELVHVHRDGIGAKFRAPLAERIARGAAIRAAAGDGGLDVDVRTVVDGSSPYRNCRYASAQRAPCPEVEPRVPASWCSFCQAHGRLVAALAHTESATDGSGEPRTDTYAHSDEWGKHR